MTPTVPNQADDAAPMAPIQPTLYPNRADFVQLQALGQLLSPADAAARVLAWLVRPDFGALPVADVRG